MVLEHWSKKQAEKLQNAIGLNYDGTKISEVGKKVYGEEETPFSVQKKQITREEQPVSVREDFRGELLLSEVKKWHCAPLDPSSPTYSERFTQEIRTLYTTHPEKFKALLVHVFANSNWRKPGIVNTLVDMSPFGAKWLVNELASDNKLNYITDALQAKSLPYKLKMNRLANAAELIHQNPQVVADHILDGLVAKDISFVPDYVTRAGRRRNPL